MKNIQEERLDFLLSALCAEEHGKNYEKHFAPKPVRIMNYQEKQDFFRALVNTRPPEPTNAEFFAIQDAYLKEELKLKGITKASSLERMQKNISLWQGDITLLAVDGIVNAANSQMLGCFLPGHACIDNFIHTYAGIQLRQDCYEIMKIQQHFEKTGKAKITKAYNLPSKYILHTVGPIITKALTDEDCELLASCYRSCLELALSNGLKSIAFCCISTGVFMFPNNEAAHIALKTVKQFQKETKTDMHIIFNVFKDLDYDIYKKLLTS